MEVLYTLLGAALAVGGGLLGQRQAEILRVRREDDAVLLELDHALLDLNAILKLPSTAPVRPPSGLPGLAKAEQDLAGADDRLAQATHRLEIVKCTERLNGLAIRLRSPEHRQIAVRTAKIALDPPFRTPENITILSTAVQLAINPEMIRQYNQDLKAPTPIF